MGDLSVTALYTSQVWAWGKLPCADLFATAEGKRVFDATNAALAVSKALGRQPWAPLRVALLQRHLMIDHLVADAPRPRIIELAAGLSRRGATLSRGTQYVEIDLPHVVDRKRALLEQSPLGRAVLERATYELVAGDVSTIELDRFIVRDQPVFVIAEGLLMYLDGYARRNLFAKLAALAELTGELHFVFDLVPAREEPPAGRIGNLLGAAMKKFTGGQTFERDAHTREQVLRELATAGFVEQRAIASYDVAAAWHLPHAWERANMIVFSARAVRSTRA